MSYKINKKNSLQGEICYKIYKTEIWHNQQGLTKSVRE